MTEGVTIIDTKLLDATTQKARSNVRLRMNHNFHDSEQEVLNRLLNAVEPGTYVRPHRHLNPDKVDAIVVLRGRVLSVVFDDNGSVVESVELSPELGRYGMEIAPGLWHTLLVLEMGTVIYEVKEGPYAPLAPENFAPWSPDVSDAKAVAEYMEKLMEAHSRINR